MSHTLMFIFVCVLFKNYHTHEHQFERIITAVGFPYYKLLFTLGTCKKQILFDEQKAWGIVKSNRILDIHYKSQFDEHKVSRVEIRLVINDTDCIARSNWGVGNSEFDATIIVPVKVAVIFYHITIYTCSWTASKDAKYVRAQDDSALNLNNTNLALHLKSEINT